MIILSNIKVPIAKPIIGEEEIENVVEVLKSGMIAQGPKVAEFEEKFAEWVGAEYGIAVNSGTAALHTALLACGIGEDVALVKGMKLLPHRSHSLQVETPLYIPERNQYLQTLI